VSLCIQVITAFKWMDHFISDTLVVQWWSLNLRSANNSMTILGCCVVVSRITVKHHCWIGNKLLQCKGFLRNLRLCFHVNGVFFELQMFLVSNFRKNTVPRQTMLTFIAKFLCENVQNEFTWHTTSRNKIPTNYYHMWWPLTGTNVLWTIKNSSTQYYKG
jgi:hypothetical protein